MAIPDLFSHNTAPDPSRAEAEELLGRIMTDLDRPQSAEADRRRFHTAVWRRFWLPRAVMAVTAALVAGLLLWLLLRPVRFAEVRQLSIEDGAAQQVAVTVRGPLLVQVSAHLDGRQLPVEHAPGGAYTVRVTRNGTLVLAADPLLGRRVTRSVTVEGMDEERPRITADERDGDDVVLHLTDGDGTGIDWAGITLTLDSGAAYPGLTVDESAGTVRFPLPTEVLHITVPDRSGNRLQATLTPDTAG